MIGSGGHGFDIMAAGLAAELASGHEPGPPGSPGADEDELEVHSKSDKNKLE